MDDFTEIDEIGRKENEAEEIYNKITKLMSLKTLNKEQNDKYDEEIKRLKKELVEIRTTLKMLNINNGGIKKW